MRAAMFRQSQVATQEMEASLHIGEAADIEVPDFAVSMDQPATFGISPGIVAQASATAVAERAVVGAILANNDLYDYVIELLDGDSFRDSVARTVFAAAAEIIEGRVDGVTVAEPLTIAAQPGVDAVVGLAELDKLRSDSETRVDIVMGRARIVREAALARSLDTTIEEVQKLSADGRMSIDEKQDKVFTLLAGHAEMKSLPMKSLGDAAGEALAAMVDRADKGETGIGITTGIPDLDALIAGFCGGQFIVLAARPGVGKTALALTSALAAGAAGHRVVMASMEMKATELSKRALAITSGVDSNDIRMGSLSESDWESLADAGARLKELPVDIVDMPSITVSALGGLARRLKKAGQLDMLIIDYLQIMETSDAPGTNRQEHIAFLSRQLKKIAMALDIPVVALSQLKRPQPGHESKPPQLTDLRESGAIEQDADVVIFLHRPDVADKTAGAESTADVIVEKQRAGPQGVVQVRFERKTTGFYPLNTYGHPVAANDPLRYA